jgi:pimeloyl-ACP methyl ester carboxylesterase
MTAPNTPNFMRGKPMSYATARRFEIRDALSRRIDTFAKGYIPGCETIVLLPGGMGSQLDRSTKAYKSDDSIPFKTYDPIWVDMGLIFSKDALKLKIKPDGSDKGHHIVVPNGPLEFFVSPYEAAGRFFKNEGYNYTVFGFDWRRSIAEAASYLEYFLKGIRARVKKLKGADPLPDTTLVCHSMGGLVAVMFLQRLLAKSRFQPGHIKNWLKFIVTAGTPFYGASTHMQRYYFGEKMLNTLNGKKPIARMVSTLPGPHILMYLDRNAFDDYRNRFRRRSEQPEINRYPSRDANDPDQLEADPYDPRMFKRYPSWMEIKNINQARKLRNTMISSLPKPVLERIFHIRSQSEKTWIEQSWQPIDGSKFNPDKKSPLSGVDGPGDGTVPFWSARLAQTPPAQVYDVKNKVEHQELLEHSEVLQAVRRIIETGNIPAPLGAYRKRLGEPKAESEEVNGFLEDIVQARATINDSRAADKKYWRRIMQETSLC